MCRRPEEVKAAQHSYGDDRDDFFRLKKKYIDVSQKDSQNCRGGKKQKE